MRLSEGMWPVSIRPVDYQDDLLSFAQALVRLPSPSGEEEKVAHRLAEEMERLGFDAVWIDPVGNAIGRIGTGEGPVLLYNGHMDTVGVGDPAAWTRDPFGGEIVEGRLYGRGAVDMKGPLAAMVYGAWLFRQRRGRGGKGTLYVVGVVQEEPREGRAMQALVEENDIHPDAILLGEPSNFQVKRGHRGRLEIRVITRGRACHASNPAAGENALYAAARIIFGIELLAASLPSDPVLGPGTIAVTHIETISASRNAIPDRAELVIDRRLTLGETEVKALAEVQSVVQKEGVRAEVFVPEYEVSSYTDYRMRGREYYPTWLISEDHPFLRQVIRGAEKALGTKPSVGVWAFSTDGVFTMGEAGIPTVGFGPGDEALAHTADEHIAVRDLLRAVEAYAAIAQEVLGK